jgi:hypothetical protein
MSDPGRSAAPPPFTWETPAGTPGAAAAPTGGQPKTAGEIYDRAPWIYRRGFVILLTVVAVVQIPVAVISALVQPSRATFASFTELSGESTPDQVSTAFQNAFPSIASAGLTVGLVSFIGGLLLSPALIATIARVHQGEPVSLGDAYASAFRSVLSILGGSILSGLAVLGVIVAFVVLGILVAVAGGDSGLGGVGVVIATLGAIVAAVYLVIRWTVWSQAVVLERRGPVEALVRSWSLMRGSMWRVLGIVFVTGIALLIAGLVLGVIGGILGAALPNGWQGLPAAMLGILTASWVPIVTTLIFFDLRARREGPAMAPVVTTSPAATPAPMTDVAAAPPGTAPARPGGTEEPEPESGPGPG